MWVILKDQLEGKNLITKIYIITLLYTSKLEEGSLDEDGYVKSTNTVWGKLKDVNLKLYDELVVFMALLGFPSSFGTQNRILKSRKDPCIEIIKKDLRQEALRSKALQSQLIQEYLAVNFIRKDSHRHKTRFDNKSVSKGILGILFPRTTNT